MTTKIKVKKIIPEYRLNAEKRLSSLHYIEPDQIKKLEEHIYGYSCALANKNGHTTISRIFKNIYINKLMHIMANLEEDNYVNNTYRIEKIKDKSIEPYQLVNMSFREMAPEKWAFYDNKESATITAVFVSDLESAKTTLFTCSRCKKNECVYYQMQTRSCDEGTTNFITCLLCKKKWRQYN